MAKNVYEQSQEIYNSIGYQRKLKEKEVILLEKKLDRKSDRRFLWTVTLVSAIVGSVVAVILTLIAERFFK